MNKMTMTESHKQFNKAILPILRNIPMLKWSRTYSQSYKYQNTTKLYVVSVSGNSELEDGAITKSTYFYSINSLKALQFRILYDAVNSALFDVPGYINVRFVLKPYCKKTCSILIYSR